MVPVRSADPQWQCFSLLGSALLIEDVQNDGTYTFLPRWLPVVNGATRIDYQPFEPCDSGETEAFGYRSPDFLSNFQKPPCLQRSGDDVRRNCRSPKVPDKLTGSVQLTGDQRPAYRVGVQAAASLVPL